MQTITEWRHRAEMLTPPFPWDRPQWHDTGGPTVVLLHGLWRGWRAMQPLARALENDGFSTLNIPYPSARLPIHHLVTHVRHQIEDKVGDGPVHFITHSLGGILLRSLLAGEVRWKTGRAIMLAPPNAGSEIVDWSKKHPLLHIALGPAGRELASDGVPQNLPALPSEVRAAVIMGNRCSIPIFKKLLGDENDGIVSAAKGRIDGLCGFSVINADHTFIQTHPEAIRLSLEFLKTGVWPG
ncbi:alpha/beta hydrolase [Luteolibacter yonseiensis]|uniref:Alpha/beta hydrolase n=1 Tax=Luteolibacter yonseiensis TaxID=1144680 RepID=A0A934RAF9_9BACT|nr:alpha/beta fold hydrolase [Luteolibacter yonseiensis]MBK1818125.1 alpha/beta hydrolase [Luteolibacter yonseiensis]